jgi:Glycosyl transferase family 64 domain
MTDLVCTAISVLALTTGISSSAHHFEARSQCIDYFAEQVGEVPLITSTFKVVPAKDLWFWN